MPLQPSYEYIILLRSGVNTVHEPFPELVLRREELLR